MPQPNPSPTRSPSSKLDTLLQGLQTREQRRTQAALDAGLFPLPDAPTGAADAVPIRAIEAATDPPKSNTGVRIRTGFSGKPLATHGFTPSNCTLRTSVKRDTRRTPSDYYTQLRVDTLKLTARVATDSVDDLGYDWVEKKRAAEAGREPAVEAHDSKRFSVQPHSPSDNRAVLMQGQGIDVTAVPTCDVPFISFLFRAPTCWNNSPEQMADWARSFCDFYGMDVTSTLVSRLDLCTDVSTPFVRSDVDRFKGYFGGDLTGTVSFSDGRSGFTGFRYDRTANRDLTFRVYDKRAEAESHDGRRFWEDVWEAYELPEQSPIWRVEYEAKRGRLRERGIDTWQDLSPSKLESFWTYCTTDFARMEDDVWTDDVQGAANEPAADRAAVEPTFDPTRLKAQAAGCVKRIAEETGMDPADVLDQIGSELQDSA